MLNRKRRSLGGHVEHVEDYCFTPIVFTMVNGSDHFNNGLPLMNHLDISIDVNDSEFALLNKTEIYHVMMVPTKFLAWWKLISNCDYLSIFLRESRKVCAVPTL